MKIILLHNRYRQPGGEDGVFEAERLLLEAHGHTVVRVEADNREISGLGSLGVAVGATWSVGAKRRLSRLIARERPDMIHCHNLFPLFSPSVYYAAAEAGVPTVQTVHNFRLLCPNGLLFRDGHVCEECLSLRFKAPAVRHGCYRGSRLATAPVTAMLAVHQALGTWTGKVSRFIALTEFSRQKLIEGGLPGERIVVKPNFLSPDPGVGEHTEPYCLFVGRLTEEKGVGTLLAAWRLLGRSVPLKIVGDGPLAPNVAAFCEGAPHVEWLGWRPKAQVVDLMKRARLLVFPSQWYEGFPLVLVEAGAVGLPVVAGNLGAMASIVRPDETGFLFEPGSPEDLAAKVARAIADPAGLEAMSGAARREFEAHYTAERSYERLMAIYEAAGGQTG